MKIHRFIGSFDMSKEHLEIRDKDVVHQISRVLKLSAGEYMILGDGSGNEAEVILKTVSKSLIEATVLSRRVNENEPKKFVTLYLAILKKDNFELAIQKAVEVGVSKIVPMITERTVKINLNTERIETIIREASEQAGRGIVPELSPILSFDQALSSSNPKESILFDLSGSPLSAPPYSLVATSLFVGPEGGFTEAEVAKAKEAGCFIGSLGPLTLRGETAAIVGSYLVVHS